ncbi:hypothetical protein CO666_25445 [Rhizobium chutanense]|uniref:LuxR family transcriptional regulator n=1 Tax=Rhizobium chutanense TaxID=2035448 RepID=A0A2A6J6F5_9HYPH|nr:hypothetical protein CO666_25445 [Rhizobium chutanense]
MLPPSERSCLRWLSRGRTLEEVALLQGKSVTEVEHCLERVLASLEADSIAEAIQKTNASISNHSC